MRENNNFFTFDANGNIVTQQRYEGSTLVDDLTYQYATNSSLHLLSNRLYSDGVIDYYTAYIISVSDYSPFGVELANRSWSIEEYRNGFQKQEQDKELWEGAMYYKYRVEDPRLGRFFSVDPLYAKYPYNSNYAFSENVLINAVELEGLEAFFMHGTKIADTFPLSIVGFGDYSDQVSGDNLEETSIKEFLEYTQLNFDNGCSWNGLDTPQAREMAGIQLAKYVMSKHQKGQKIVLFGHSHGGNACIAAADFLVKFCEISPSDITVIALNTPKCKEIELNCKKINLITISAHNDYVQKSSVYRAQTGVLTRYRPHYIVNSLFLRTRNVEVSHADSRIYYDDQIDYTFDFTHCGWDKRNVNVWMPKLIEVMKGNQNTFWSKIEKSLFLPFKERKSKGKF